MKIFPQNPLKSIEVVFSTHMFVQHELRGTTIKFFNFDQTSPQGHRALG